MPLTTIALYAPEAVTRVCEVIRELKRLDGKASQALKDEHDSLFCTRFVVKKKKIRFRHWLMPPCSTYEGRQQNRIDRAVGPTHLPVELRGE